MFVKRIIPLVVLLALFAGFFWFDLDRYLTFQALSDHRDSLLAFVADHYLTALALYFVLYAVSVAASIPGGVLMTVTGGFLFGWWIAGLVTVVSATLGATLVFLVAETALGEPLRRKAGPWLRPLEVGFQKNALNYLLFLRLVPAFPFWLVNIAPAFLGVPLRTYVVGTFVGIIPGTFVFAFLGTGLDSVILEQQQRYADCLTSGATDCTRAFQISSLLTPEVIVAFVALGLIALLPVILDKIRRAKPDGTLR
ncbi:TVP38/TMEM64 family protein [Sneathiella chinensis]|uniref:TVP38/TMEM64 family membrane protein n=1 Tax=Sneathiella chinensis TaxID=349750 RepID=A0ABQ5U0V7_9PROT|nr:VTT domain-containing protein [Sneathiella chinensis]GLQ05453.1 hypothetical protein GCM10007924_06740 [Sneathiella chinensis]